MAQGGRGWFHRKRHQPAPEPTENVEPLTAEQIVSTIDQQPEPADAGAARRNPGTHEGAGQQASVASDPTPPGTPPLPSVFDPPSPRDAPSPDRGPAAPARGGDADGSVDGSRRNGSDSGVDAASGAAEPSRRVATAVDWDAATAAALSDEYDGTPSATSRPPLPPSNADRLLEDIIREIVGDAAVDTASSLQPARQERPAAPAAADGGDFNEASRPAASDSPIADRTHESRPDADLRDLETDTNAVLEQSGPGLDAATVVDAFENEQVRDESASPGASAQLGPANRLSSDLDGIVAPAPDAIAATPAADPEPGALTTSAAPTIEEERPDAAKLLSASSPTALVESPSLVSRETMDEHLYPPVSRETVTEYGGTPLADQLADETRRRIALEEAVLPLPASTRVLTISNQKGGVGKTTTAVNLAAALARSGAHVLVIDLDPQGNASTALGVDHRSEQQSVYDVLVSDLSLGDVIRTSTEHESLDCVPATIHLAGAEIELVSLVAREQRLRRALDRHLEGMERPYDYVLIDCPPSLGLLTINAFVAAREVLIPIQCEYYALEGLSQLLSNIELIEKHLNPELRLSTILLTMYDSRTNLAQQVAQEVREHFPSQTLDTIIPRSVRVSEAPSYGQSVISYDYGSSGSLSYREAAAEIAWRGTTDEKETH